MDNGLHLPEIPEELKDLTETEERLPFMQIKELKHVDKQYGLKGNIVNVPISVDMCQYSSSKSLRYVIRPFKIYKAAEYLRN